MQSTSESLGGLAKFWLALLGIVIFASGLFFTIGGIKLVTLGGSAYFALTGILLLVSGVQIMRKRASGALVFGVAFLLTAIWAVWDVGLVFWPLFSRLFAMAVGAVVVALSYPLLRRAAGQPPHRAASYATAGVLALGSAATFAAMFQPHPPVPFTGEVAALVPVDPAREQKNWDNYGNDAASTRFVALDQITRDNVKNLKVAWTYRTGDIPQSDGNGAEDQTTPLQIGDTVFLCTPHNNVIALDADTGKEKWKTVFNAKSSVWMRCRGLAYFDATAPLQQPAAPGSTPVPAAVVPAGAPCQRRILMNTITAQLYALDADTGKLCPGFGDNGRVDLKVGIGSAPDPHYVMTSPPTMAGSTVVVGGRVADNVQVDMPGGEIRGFDVITGKLRWVFDPGNPTDRSAPKDGKTYVRSTPNVWAPMSYDAATNTVFMPLGSPSVDLYGVTRTRLDHEYGASILALDATTGNEKWHFQTVHNDLWDFDLPMQPTLTDFPMGNGRTVPALIIGAKTGMIWVLDRATGKPLTKVEQVTVKASDIPHEPYSLYQPVSLGMPQIGNTKLTEADMWGMTPFDQLLCRIKFKGMRHEGVYTAIGTDLSLSFPGSLGGMNWGGLSIDPNTRTIFANDMRIGLWQQMFPDKGKPTGPAATGGESVNVGMGEVPLKGTPYSVLKDRFLSALGVPCQAPPFGTLTAIDMDTRKVKWQVPVGTVEDTGPMGIRMGMPVEIGMPTLGGTLATQGGLVFIAGTQDFYLRAYDSATGKEVWKGRLPVGSQGGPMSYKSPKTGKQYVVVTAGGARQSPERGDYVIAYTLK